MTEPLERPGNVPDAEEFAFLITFYSRAHKMGASDYRTADTTAARTVRALRGMQDRIAELEEELARREDLHPQ